MEFEVNGVGRLDERRFGAAAVAFVAFGDLRGQLLGRDFRLFSGTPANTFNRVGVEENLYPGIRENDGSDIAAFHHDARCVSHLTLLGYERRRTAPIGRNSGSRDRDFGRRGWRSLTSSLLSRT